MTSTSSAGAIGGAPLRTGATTPTRRPPEEILGPLDELDPVSRIDAAYSATRTGSTTRDVPTDTATIRAPATRYPGSSPWWLRRRAT